MSNSEAARELSIVLQGDVRPETASALRGARAAYPAAELIFSTWEGTPPLEEFAICDRVLFSKDPGPLETTSTLRNLPRQVVSTMAGIAAATRTIVVKVRSDVILNAGLAEEAAGLERDKLAVWRNFTAAPQKTRLLFHPSDMLQMGSRELMAEYWAGEISRELSRSVLLPEQYLFLRFLERRGEVRPPLESYLAPKFRNLRRHARAFARHIRILPRGAAVLPERLRIYDQAYQQDRDFTGRFREAAGLALRLRVYPWEQWLRRVVRRARVHR